jgi:ABC-type phosphate/phosphonate transport system ATPase subunit
MLSQILKEFRESGGAISLNELSRRIGVEPSALDGMGNRQAGMEDVVAAAKAACCHEFIERLPEGYRTKIGEGGAYLSGGEAQRVAVARAILKNAPILALDICHQLEVMETLLSLVRSKNIAAIMAMHDLNMASRYADRVLMLKGGRVYTEGPPVNVFTAENIARVYGVDASVRIDDDGKPSIVPIRRVGFSNITEDYLEYVR